MRSGRVRGREEWEGTGRSRGLEGLRASDVSRVPQLQSSARTKADPFSDALLSLFTIIFCPLLLSISFLCFAFELRKGGGCSVMIHPATPFLSFSHTSSCFPSSQVPNINSLAASMTISTTVFLSITHFPFWSFSYLINDFKGVYKNTCLRRFVAKHPSSSPLILNSFL